jgi:N6-L-threonylcarbamoyladenine synthase
MGNFIVGVECTAHTFGVGVVDDRGKILANARDMFITESGGIVPIEAGKHHLDVADKIWSESLKKANIKERDIKVIALANAPGLAPCLVAGMNFAKKKALELNVKIIEVNHCVAHLEIGRSLGSKDAILLYASGANTQIIGYTADSPSPRMPSTSKNQKIEGSGGRYRIFGETLDIGIGNFLDKFARHVGLGFPGGPKLELLAKKSNESKFIELPYAIKGMDVSFSGMETKLQQLYGKGAKLEDLSFSMQETVFAMLVEAAERALAHTGKKELVLGGGVGCNARLQDMCKKMCKARGAKFFVPAREFLVDNGGMIAYTGWIMCSNLFRKKVHQEQSSWVSSRSKKILRSSSSKYYNSN